MTTAIPKINYQDTTKLPLKELAKGDKLHSELVVFTPHKGTVIIPTVEGWLFKTEKDASDVLRNLKRLENEAKEYLLDEWLKTSNS